MSTSSEGWDDLKQNCYQTHTITPFYIIILGMLTSLFINCYMFFSGQTVTTRFLLYLRRLCWYCCCCCFSSNKQETIIEYQLQQLSKSRDKIKNYPYIIQISSINTKDPKVLDICGYYKRIEKLSDSLYLYQSTFKSYISKSILILHYSDTPNIIITKSNTITFDDTQRSTISHIDKQWIITSLNTKGIIVNTEISYGSILKNNDNNNNCDTIAIQNNNNNKNAEDKNISLIKNPLQSLLLKPFQRWLFEDEKDIDTQYKHILNITPSTLNYIITNFIALIMVILAIYQIIIDIYEFHQFIMNNNNNHFQNYQCYGIIIINSPSFKQIFLIVACLIIGRTNAIIFVQHLNYFRKLLGIIYIIYPILFIPIFLTHIIPFIIIYLSPFIVIFGCIYWKLLKIQRQNRIFYRDNDNYNEYYFWFGFIFLFIFYILCIVGIGTMSRFYDKQNYIDSLWNTLWERNGSNYLKNKVNQLQDIEQSVEILYRLI